MRLSSAHLLILHALCSRPPWLSFLAGEMLTCMFCFFAVYLNAGVPLSLLAFSSSTYWQEGAPLLHLPDGRSLDAQQQLSLYYESVSGESSFDSHVIRQLPSAESCGPACRMVGFVLTDLTARINLRPTCECLACRYQSCLSGPSAAWYATLILCQQGHVWVCKTRFSSIFNHPIFENKITIMGMALASESPPALSRSARAS